MRFVHDVEWDYPESDKVCGRVFVTAAAPYGGRLDDKPTYKGARAEVTFLTTASEDEVVLTGSFHDIREALQEALEMLASIEESYKEDFEDHAANAVQCQVCKTWYDQRCAPNIEHADGCGNTCFGDGTVFVTAAEVQRLVVNKDLPDGEWLDLDREGFATLRKGDVFRFTSTLREAEHHIRYQALSDAFKRFRPHRHPPVAELGVLVGYVSREKMEEARVMHLVQTIRQGSQK